MKQNEKLLGKFLLGLGRAQEALDDIAQTGCFDSEVLCSVTVNKRGRPTGIRLACTGRTHSLASQVRLTRSATMFVDPKQVITKIIGCLSEDTRPIDWGMTQAKVEKRQRTERSVEISIEIRLRFRP